MRPSLKTLTPPLKVCESFSRDHVSRGQGLCEMQSRCVRDGLKVLKSVPKHCKTFGFSGFSVPVIKIASFRDGRLKFFLLASRILPGRCSARSPVNKRNYFQL